VIDFAISGFNKNKTKSALENIFFYSVNIIISLFIINYGFR